MGKVHKLILRTQITVATVLLTEAVKLCSVVHVYT